MERKEQDKSQELRDVHFLKYLIGYMYFFFSKAFLIYFYLCKLSMLAIIMWDSVKYIKFLRFYLELK